MMKKTAIIIVAGGTGSRFGSTLPKQYCLMAGIPVLMHTIGNFRRCFGEDADIILTISKDMLPLWIELCDKYSFKSPEIAFGGATRAESVRNALTMLSDKAGDTIVLIHDGVRPLVSHETIRRVEAAVKPGTGVAPSLPMSDSIRELTAEATESRSVPRAAYRTVQTPQGFTHDDILKAYETIPDNATDDLSVFEAAGGRISLVAGNSSNIKITNPEDIHIAEAIMKFQQK